MKPIAILAMVLLCLVVVFGCSSEPKQYRTYEYDIYTPNGELFTTVRVKSVYEPQCQILYGEKTAYAVNGPGDLVRVFSIPREWMIVRHGEKLGR